jgi:hypothetical protein
MAYYNIQSADFGGPDGAGFPKSFAEATLGRGSMDTVLIPEPSFLLQLASEVALLLVLGRRRTATWQRRRTLRDPTLDI